MDELAEAHDMFQSAIFRDHPFYESPDKPVFASKARPALLQEKDGALLPESNGIRLSSLSPGSYELRILVADRRTNEVAWRGVDFTVH